LTSYCDPLQLDTI